MIADTSFIIDVMNGDHDAIQKAKLLQPENSPISVTSVSIFEL
jgi:predicted nucleic acid-binding protein